MNMVSLSASARNKDASAKQIRHGGRVPCIVYGNIENTQLECEENALKKAFIKAGESTLVELDLEGKKVPVLFHTIDFDPVSDRFRHVDFYAVDMKKEVEAPVSIRLEGESLAVKDMAAIIVTALDTVTVRCLPSNLPHDLAVDLGKLVDFGSTITVADIAVPAGVTIIEAPETVLVLAQQPREEEKEEPKPAEGEVAAAGAEGAPATEGAAAPADAKKDDKKE